MNRSTTPWTSREPLRSSRLAGRTVAAALFSHAAADSVDADFSQAASYYDLACTGGDAEGCYELARLYDAGSGVPKDADRARAFFEKACTGGFAEACGRN